MTKKKSTIDFAASFSELDTIVQWFERGEPDLEQGLTKFARASELVKQLKERLTEAENVIKEVK